MQDAADPVDTVNPSDSEIKGEIKGEGANGDGDGDGDGADPKEIQVPSLSDIFFNGGRGSLDLKMTKSEHNPRKFSRRIAQTPDKKAPHRTSATCTGMHKANLTSSKSGGIPGASDHGSLRSYRRSNSFSRRRSHHPEKRKNGNEVDPLRASESSSASANYNDNDSEELKASVTLNPSVSTGTSTNTGSSLGTVSRRRTGMPGASGHRRARPSRVDAEARHSSQQEHPRRRHNSNADTCEDQAESSTNGRLESDSNEFLVQVNRADSLPHSLTNGQDDENAHNTHNTPTTGTTEIDPDNHQEGKPRSLSFDQKAAPRKQMSRGDSNSSADKAAVRPRRSSHSSERRRHRRTMDPGRPLANSLTNATNGTTTSPTTTPSNEQDLSKRTRATRHGTAQGSWTRNLRRMKKTTEEDGDWHPTNSTSPQRVQKEDGTSESSKMESDSKKMSALQEETNSQRQRRREVDDNHRDSKKASEDDKKSHHSHQDQNPISSSGRSSVPSSPSTPRRHQSKSFHRASGGNVPIDETRSPPLSQFLDSLLVGNKEKVIVEESVLSAETTTTQDLTTPAQVDFFAIHDNTNELEPILPHSFDKPLDNLPTNLFTNNEITNFPVDRHDQQNNDATMDTHHVTSQGEIHLTGNDKPDHRVFTNNQGFDHAKSPTKDLLTHNFEDFGAREATATFNNKDGRGWLRSPTEHNTKMASTAHQGNKPTPFPARNPMLPKGNLFSPNGRPSSMFFDKEALDQGIKKLANLNLSVTSHGRKKKGLNKFLTTTMKFNKLADGGDSVCLDDLPFAKESTETTRLESAKTSHVPLDKMFMKSNTSKDYDDTLNDSGGLSFSMDLAVSEPTANDKRFTLSAQPSRRGLFAKKPKKFQTFDDSGIIQFSLDDTPLPKQSWQDFKKGTSLDLPLRELSKTDDHPSDRSVFGAGFDLDAHLSSSVLDNPSQDKTATLDSRKSRAQRDHLGGGISDDFAWESPRVADNGKSKVFQKQSTRSKPADLPDPSICGEDRGSKLQELLEQPGHRKLSQLAEPSICGTLVEGGKIHAKEELSFTANGVLGDAEHGKGELLSEDDENLSTASLMSDKDKANPLPDDHRGMQLKDVLNDATLNPAPSDASVCDQSVMTLEQQQHFLQLNLPGMTGYKSSSSLSVLEHAVEVLGDSAGRRGPINK